MTATLAEVLANVWKQSLADALTEVGVEGHRYQVDRTHAKGLRIVVFSYQGHTIEGIEQNPQTSSRWAKFAQEGKRIMQFKAGGRYFANVCEGAVTHYPSWKGLGLPE